MTIAELLQLQPPDLIYQFYLPFLLILVITYASLRLTNIFGKNVTWVIAFIATFLVANSELFPLIGQYIAYFGATISVGAFAIIFVIGIALYGVRKQDAWTGYERKIESLEKQKEKLFKKYQKSKSPAYSRTIEKEIERIDSKIRYYQNEANRGRF